MIAPLFSGPSSADLAELNDATKKYLRGMPDVVVQVKVFEELAEKCHAAARLGPTVQGSPLGDKMDLEALLAKCPIKPAGGLVGRVRKVLRMGPSKEELAAAKKAFEAKRAEAKREEAEARDTKAKQLAKAAGTTVERARKAVDSSNGDDNLAMSMLLSEAESNRLKKTMTTGERKATQKAVALAEVEGGRQEAGMLAGEVDSLARNTGKQAWKRMRDEFECQVRVWDTSAAMGGGGRSYNRVQEEFQGVFEEADVRPESAPLLLQAALQNALRARHKIGNGVTQAADGVQDAQRLTGKRDDLSKYLRALANGRGEAGPTGPPWDPDLVQACALPAGTSDRVFGALRRCSTPIPAG